MLRDKLVSDRKSDCYEEVSCHGTHEHHRDNDFCLGLNHMENGGLDRETGQECLWPVYDSHHAWQRKKVYCCSEFSNLT